MIMLLSPSRGSMTKDILQIEYDYYLAHRAELAEEYAGKVLAIKGCSVIGVFDSEFEALQKTNPWIHLRDLFEAIS